MTDGVALPRFLSLLPLEVRSPPHTRCACAAVTNAHMAEAAAAWDGASMKTILPAILLAIVVAFVFSYLLRAT